jgi:hypothetical protein
VALMLMLMLRSFQVEVISFVAKSRRAGSSKNCHRAQLQSSSPMLVIAYAVKRSQARIDCFAALAMTNEKITARLARTSISS